MKLHLGCGKRYLPGYTHIDLAHFDHIDHNHDIRHLPMIADNSADLIYSSHNLPYFDRVEIVAVLREWRRVLKPGGTLRLALSDFEALVKVYQRDGNLADILGPLFGRWPIPGTPDVIYQKTAYDAPSLQTLLQDNGFENVRRWKAEEVFTGALAGFDDHSQAYKPHMDKENGIHISLNLEATKTR